MIAKTVIAAAAIAAFGITPALAGSNCPAAGHANASATVVDANQSTPADAQTYTAIPYPLPLLEQDTQTAAVTDEAATTTE